MKSKSVFIIIFIIAVLVLVKILFLSPKTENKPTQKGGGAKPPSSVLVYIANKENIDNKIFATGTLQANEKIELRPEISGKLVAIYFKEGTRVQKGALLAKIYDSDLQAQLKRLVYQKKLAKEKSDRLKSLLDIQGVSVQEYDEGTTQIKLVDADIEYVKAQIAKTEIHAPFSGLIGLRQVSQGAYVTPSSVIATIQETNRLKIDFPLPEKNINYVKLGDKVQFKLDNADTYYTAVIYAMEPKVDEQTRDFQIRAICETNSPTILPGSFARVSINPSKEQTAIMIPTEAIIPELKGKKVFVVKEGIATSTPVTTGFRNDRKIEVIEGLTVGDTIVVTGIMSLRPNDKVSIKEVLNN